MLTPNPTKHSVVIGMKEAKKTFPGSIISKILFVFSALASGGLFVGSIFFEGEDVSGITDHLHLIPQYFAVVIKRRFEHDTISKPNCFERIRPIFP